MVLLLIYILMLGGLNMNELKPQREFIIAENSTFPVRVFTASTTNSKVIAPPHFHDNVELIYQAGGNSILIINEQKT